MKRSEMVGKIEAVIAEISAGDPHNLACWVLEVVEEAGMLPPYSVRSFRKKGKDGDYMSGTAGHKWEPEE